MRHLSLADFRSYASAEVALSPGVTTLLGRNGEGKTNLVEAVGYLATLGSHRVAQDAPLVRFGADQAIVRGAVLRAGRESLVELSIVPGRANKARLGRAAVARPRDVLGTVRTVLFAPEDLALVKGEPEQRRRFLDDLLVQRQPRWAGVRSDYDRIVRQRNALLRTASAALGSRRGRRRAPAAAADQPPPQDGTSVLHTLDVWDSQLATVGGQLLYARLRLLRDLRPLLSAAYDTVSDSSADARAVYRSTLGEQEAAAVAAGEVPEPAELTQALARRLQEVRTADVERGVGQAGLHRDDLVLSLGDMPAKGYVSHGESWSFALGLRLAAFRLLRNDLQDDPILVLDDVFAELDSGRRERLAADIADCEQVLITAAVPHDVPPSLSGARLHVRRGTVTPQPDDRPDDEPAAPAGPAAPAVAEPEPPGDGAPPGDLPSEDARDG
nr:DNA replication/repair protein RecF [Kineosphaera limosa]